MRSPYPWVAAGALIAGLVLAPLSAAAATIKASPVYLSFENGQQAEVLELSNPGDTPLDVQVRVFAWSMDDAGEHFAPTSEVLFSPPIARLAPHGRQIVRLALKGPARKTETAYRVFVDQLPGPAREGQVQLPVRLVLPLFAEPAGKPGEARLRWRAALDARTHTVTLRVENTGARRARLVDLAYVDAAGVHVIAPGLSGYVLAGQHRTWTFAYPGGPGPIVLRAADEEGPIEVETDLAAD